MVSSNARIAWEEFMRAVLLVVEQTHIKRTMEHIDCVDYGSLQASHFR